MKAGFRWCPHCKRPHGLDDRVCASTGQPLDTKLHVSAQSSSPYSLLGVVLDGKYKILRLIGEGGIGEVFEAESIHLKRLVAIKVVRRGARPEALLRLEREALLIAAIQHPNICGVHDVGRMPDGGPYVVLERLFGETLAARMRGGRLSVRAVVDIFSQMLFGLQAAHSASIVHRDLKPENVFLVTRVGCDPLVKLLDFGFAQDLSPTTAMARITRPGRLCGTARYMSPEQLRCQPLDHRSDLFAVGIMLYETLAGRHPFQGRSILEVQMNIVSAAPLPLRVRRPDVPPELEALITWALSRSRLERPSSATELQRALLSLTRSPSLASIGDEEPASLTEPAWLPPSSSPEA